jgi:phage terminase small subunit
MPGPGKKPTSLKVVAGTERKDRKEELILDMPALSVAPSPPDWLNAHAQKEWHRLVPILLSNKILTEASLGSLAQMCALFGKVVQLYAAGEAPTASMLGTLRNLSNDFGLTPVAQGKVKFIAEDQPANKFAANGKR